MDESVVNKVELFFGNYPKKRFDDEQIIVYAGDDPPGVMLLLSGHVRQYDISEKGEEIVVNVFKPGAFFPMMWAVSQVPNQYFYQASGEVELHQAPAPQVVTFVKDNPDVMFDLLSRVYRGITGIERRMAHLMGGTARSRVLYELLIESRRFAKRQRDGSQRLDLSEDELAKRAGLTRETVNRELRKLKSTGLLQITREAIVITSLDSLREQLGDNL